MIVESINNSSYQHSELIYSSKKSLIYRAERKNDRKSVIIKLINHPDPNFRELGLLRNQYNITKNLNLQGIIKSYSLEQYHHNYALVMEDIDGISLSDYLCRQPLELEQFLTIGIAIADILAGLYRARVIHKNIKLNHIIINPDTQQIKLIDFSIASLLPRETQTIESLNLLEGSLAYLSPEQTGRMNRGIDYRTDFYSLGVTFYQLLTGQLPFQSNDPIELVYSHLAKTALPVYRVNPQIPIALSDIVDKLMAKNAEDRYQNALGLKYDLQQCLIQWQTTGKIDQFIIAQKNRSDLCTAAFSGRFLIPEKLYGREQEIARLIQAFERVSNGNSELILVAGYSGIGKTAIINEIHKPIVRQRGYFIQGKYDQFNRSIPLSGFLQAFQELIAQILGETDRQLERWQSKIIEALGDNAQVLLEVIPELEKIIGKQPKAIELNSDAAQNRFNLLFEKFIAVFATSEHPLVIFLDDLQWADSASLSLIELLISKANQGYLLLICAYRDNEVDPAHPLILTLAEIEKTQTNLNKITLAPLSEHHVNQLLADTLNHCEAITLPLTRLVYQKTQGNPFFISQFLKGLKEEELITFNFESGLWQWDLTQIEVSAITDDVVEFMILQLQKLAQTSQQIIKLAACIGNQFDLTTLAIVSQKSKPEIATDLWEVLQKGLILPTTENHKYFQNQDWETNQELHSTENIDHCCTYRFLHDRVQQAAYALSSPEEKQLNHYSIGNLLLNHFTSAEQEVHLFEIVGHLNIANPLITKPDRREQLIQLNLMAARKARISTAYTAAIDYFTTAIALVGAEAWQDHYQLTLTLHNERLEVACLNKDYEQLDEWAEIILQNATNLLDTVPVYESLITKARSQGEFQKAIAIGLQTLKLLGVEFPQQPTSEDVAAVAAKTKQLWQGHPLSLLNLPAMNDPHQIARMQIMTKLIGSAFLANPHLLPLLIFKQVELSILNGNCPISIIAYADYGLLLCGILQNIDAGSEFGKLALTLLAQDQTQSKLFKSRIYFIVYTFIDHWKEPLVNSLPFLLEGYKSGLEVGDWECVSLSLVSYNQYKYLSGQSLSEIAEEIDTYENFINQIKQSGTLKHYQIFQQTILNLLGEVELPYYLCGDVFNAETTIPLLQAANDETALSYIYINQAILCYLFGQEEEAWQQSTLAQQYKNALCGYFLVAVHSFYHALILLTRYPKAAATSQQEMWQQIEQEQEKLKFWAKFASSNHQHKWELVTAEKCRVLGQRLEAIEHYDRAIALAQEHGFIQEQALSNELAAKFYLDWGKAKIAKVYLKEAYDCYSSWGAKAKLKDLSQRYPNLLGFLEPQLNDKHLATQNFDADQTTSQALDYLTILKTYQALSSEINLDKLLISLLKAICANAGANKGVLILVNENILMLKAIAIAEQEPLLVEVAIEDSCEIPLSLIYSVKRTQEAVVIADATKESRLATETYFLQNQPQSLLCTPILQQGKLLGILYLENNLTCGAFTSVRLELINLLCTQAAISLENARLYRESEIYAHELEQSLQELLSSQARFERLADNVPGVIYQLCITPDGSISMPYVSSGCYELYEIAAEDVMSGKRNLLEIEHPEDSPEVQRLTQESAQNLTRFFHQWRIITPSGVIKWVQGSSRPKRQKDGSMVWDGVVVDITARKQAEKLLQEYNQTLEREVTERTEQLSQALEELQLTQNQLIESQKMAALGNLVAGVAHEVNTPVGTCITLASTLVDHTTSFVTQIEQGLKRSDLNGYLDLVQECSQIILINLNRAGELVQNFKQVAVDRDSIEQSLINLTTYLEQIIFSLSPNFRHLGHQIKISGDQTISIETDLGALGQVITNLLMNSLKHAYQSDRVGQIKLNVFQSQKSIVVEYSDDGCGIASENLNRIFEPFFTTARHQGGTGLGLHIVYNLVSQKLQGKIEVESEVDRGTLFRLILPLKLGRKT